MSVDLHSDEPYAWLGSVQPLGRLEAAPEPHPKDGPARPEALLWLCGARVAGVPVRKPAAPSPSAVQHRAELVQRAAAEITKLSRVRSQRKLEAEMALLSFEPTRLDELARYWALPLTPEPRARRRRPSP